MGIPRKGGGVPSEKGVVQPWRKLCSALGANGLKLISIVYQEKWITTMITRNLSQIKNFQQPQHSVPLKWYNKNVILTSVK